MHPIMAYMEQNKQQMIDDLKAFVAMESPSLDKGAVDRLGGVLAARFADAGATVSVLPRAERGDILRVAFSAGQGPGQTLVLCHFDTVFAVGDLAKNPVRLDCGRLYGPGTSDMKGGVTAFLWALRCLRDLRLTPKRQVVGLLTTDEELGSNVSREAIEAEAGRSTVALVPEPAMPPAGALKTWRKGTAVYSLHVTGKPAHAGADPTKGISAVAELAHQILVLQQLTDMSVGTTVNVGLIAGGTRPNVVAGEATAEIDVRFMTLAEAHRIDGIIRGLVPVAPGAKLAVTGGVNRPPMVRNEPTIALYERARALANQLGFDVSEGGSGGASDANFTSGMGCPTLDGLGACGDGLHTLDEYIEVDRLPERAALLACLLQEG